MKNLAGQILAGLVLVGLLLAVLPGEGAGLPPGSPQRTDPTDAPSSVATLASRVDPVNANPRPGEAAPAKLPQTCEPAGAEGGSSEGVRGTGGRDWTSEIVYFILLDRFHDGDPTNNPQVDRADPHGFHGGDLRGVRARLDHLQRLGVTALWLSPVYRNRPVRFYDQQPYHGYWPWDFFAVDPRFGTLADLQNLARDLHRRGMKLLLDFVVNHAGYDAPLAARFPGWFHATGNIANWEDPLERETHRIYGLPDFASDRPVVRAFFQAVARHWIDAVRPDGFRLDAVKHVPATFWADFNGRVAARQGKEFLLLGEMLDGDPRVIARTWRDGRFGSLFDFPLYYTLKDVIAGNGDCRRLGSRFAEDHRYPDPRRLATFLDNHDLDRFLTSCGGDRSRLRQALAILFTVRGIPTLMYGTEAGLAGAHAPVPDNRADMRFGNDPGLEDWVRLLTWLRRDHPVLQEGRQVHLAMSPTTYAFARVLPDAVAVVALHTGTGTARLSLPAGHLFPERHKLPDRLAGVVGEAWGPRFECTLRGRQVAVFLDRGPLPAREAAWRQAGLLQEDPRALGTVPVTFRLEAPSLPEGVRPLVIGGFPELGEWHPQASLPEMDRVGPHAWRATVWLPRHAVGEAKFCARMASQTLWFPGDNLFVETTDRPPVPLEATW